MEQCATLQDWHTQARLFVAAALRAWMWHALSGKCGIVAPCAAREASIMMASNWLCWFVNLAYTRHATDSPLSWVPCACHNAVVIKKLIIASYDANGNSNEAASAQLIAKDMMRK